MRILPVLSAVLLAAAVDAQWTAGPSFPTPNGREFAAGVFHQGRLFVLGGTPFDSNEDGAVHSIAPGEGLWTVEPGIEGPRVRNAAGVDALGRILLFGGVDGIDPEGDLGNAYVWDPIEGPKGKVAQRSAAAPPDGIAFATDDAGRLYSIGGAATAYGGITSNDVERYDAGTDTWTVLAALPSPRCSAAAVHDGRGGILVIGGYSSGATKTGTVSRYDVATGAWTANAFPDLPQPTALATAVLGANDRVYLIGGRDAIGTTNATWILDQDSGTWSAGAPLAEARESFAAALASDDHIWVCGGTNAGGGLAGVERLYTPTCPVFPAPIGANEPWAGTSLVLTATVDGGSPIDLRWRKDGAPLFDGPAAGGGTLSGADTATLVIDGCASADDGAYDLVATNGCGTATSAPVNVSVQLPPNPSGDWVTWAVMGAGSTDTTLRSVSSASAGGSGHEPDATYGSLEHPYLWELGPGGPGAHQDLTPAGSVGGAVYSVADGAQGGWYWWPYTTPLGTGYEKHACTWAGSPGSLTIKQPSGWEYGSIAQTDGTASVGTFTFSDTSTTSDGFFFPGAGTFGFNLTPSVAWGSSVAALEGEHQYGSVNLGFGVVHAAAWSGSAATFVDINPAGSSWSYVLGAGDGQAVGRATFAGQNHAALWTSGGGSFADLHPTGASASEAYACAGGLQCGVAQTPSGSRAWLWSGPGGADLDLGAVLDPRYSYSVARGVTVGDDDTITVVGYGYNSTAGRNEGLVWRLAGAPLLAGSSAISAASGGSQELGIYAGTSSAGRLYLVAGSLSGTTPGTPWGSILIPLNVDAYTTFSIAHANQAPLVSTFGVLDDQGRAKATFQLPAGLALGGLPLTAHHAAVVIDPATSTVTLATNAVALELVP